jgi:hypothetical protein
MSSIWLHGMCRDTFTFIEYYYSDSRKMRMVGHMACMQVMRNSYRNLITKPEGKKLFGRQRHRWETDHIVDLNGM